MTRFWWRRLASAQRCTGRCGIALISAIVLQSAWGLALASGAAVASNDAPSAFAPAPGAAVGAGPPADAPSSAFGVDAPELARLGPFPVGVRTLAFVDRDQPDLLAMDSGSATLPRHDRKLTVDVWYPATVPPNAPRETYHGSLPSEPPAPPATFSVPGIAVRNAPPAGTAHPLVVVSHGYSNSTVAMTWLTENLASKGYVVAAIEHDDPPITDRSQYPQLLLRRPLDIAYVTGALQEALAAEHLIDPAKTALIGYSMGGYGVLTAAGEPYPTRTADKAGARRPSDALRARCA